MRRLGGILIILAMLTPVAARAQSHPRQVVWRDDFSGSTLDLTKWQPNWLGAGNTSITPPVNSAEASCYDPAQVSVSGGLLHLRAVERGCTDSHGRHYSYASGLVNSRAHFTFTHGTLRARVWLPGTVTAENWPSVWADGTGQWPQTGEMDVLEALHGHNCWHFHSPAGGPGGCAQMGTTAGWHTVGAVWRQGRVNYWYDGKLVGTITQGLTNAPMFVILNLGMSNTISPPMKAPAEMLVDWVEVKE
jgi:beta-glucanase (GH16 family)